MQRLWGSILFLVLGASLSGAEPPTYRAVDIGSLTEWGTVATSLNNEGQVVGQANVGDFIPHTGTPAHAFVYSDGVMTDLFPGDGYTYSTATAINDAGQVVGFRRWDPMSPSQPFLYVEDTGLLFFDPFDPDPFANQPPPFWATGAARGINEEGQITGIAQGGAFLFSPPSAPAENLATDLPDGYYQMIPTALNDSGLVVGTLSKSSAWPDVEDGFLWDSGVLTILDAELPVAGTTFIPSAINAAGDIVGYVYGADEPLHGAVFSVREWSWTHLGTLGGATSKGFGINSAGDVVGQSEPAEGDVSHAFLWQDGTMYDLNDLVPDGLEIVLADAVDINDDHQIVARGYEPPPAPGLFAIWHSFLLTPASAASLIEELEEFIDGLDLHHGIENSLLVKLQHALAAVEADDVSTACNLLGAFVNEVEAQAGKKISAEDAAEAIDQATAIRELLGCG